MKRPEKNEVEVQEVKKEEKLEPTIVGKERRKETPIVRASSPIKVYASLICYSCRRKSWTQFANFVIVFKKLHTNITFTDALAHMPSYTKFLKEILSNKESWENMKQFA